MPLSKGFLPSQTGRAYSMNSLDALLGLCKYSIHFHLSVTPHPTL